MSGFVGSGFHHGDPVHSAADLISLSAMGPGSFVLTHPRGDPIDQGDTQCCVSAAVTAALEVLHADSGQFEPLSVPYHYFVTMVADGEHPEARPLAQLPGTTFRMALRRVARDGICAEHLYRDALGDDQRLDAGRTLRRPSFGAETDARRRRPPMLFIDEDEYAPSFKRLGDFDREAVWRDVLHRRQPILVGLWCNLANMEREAGCVVDEVTDQDRFAHAVLVHGLGPKGYLIRDSLPPFVWHLASTLVRADDVIVESWAIEVDD